MIEFRIPVNLIGPFPNRAKIVINLELQMVFHFSEVLRSRATVSLFHKFTSLTQGDEETGTRQNIVIYFK